jgi:hypothetical protein
MQIMLMRGRREKVVYMFAMKNGGAIFGPAEWRVRME